MEEGRRREESFGNINTLPKMALEPQIMHPMCGNFDDRSDFPKKIFLPSR